MSSTGRSIVTIGQGRRLTLSELYAVSTQKATLQWLEPFESSSSAPEAAASVDDADTKLVAILMKALNLEESAATVPDHGLASTDFLSVVQAKALLTLLAFQVAHVQGNQSLVARSLSQMVKIASDDSSNSNGALSRLARPTLVATVEALVAAIEGSADASSPATSTTTSVVTKAMIGRCLVISETAVALYVATQLAVCALPVAALTVDSTGHAGAAVVGSSKEGAATAATGTATAAPWYSEDAFDVRRPHRSMIRAAATLRAILHESRYTSSTAVDSSDASSSIMLAALRDVPQYHGPTTEQLSMAATQLELELNSQPLSADTGLDSTLVETVVKNAAAAVSIQLSKSRQRQGLNDNDSAQNAPFSLPQLVTAWTASLSDEAAVALDRIQAATPTAAATAGASAPETTSKDAVKPTDTNEFEGMSEAQVAKILRIRAEKEAKAAAKRQAKSAKGATIFGTGTHILSDILRPFVTKEASEGHVTVHFLPPVEGNSNSNSTATTTASTTTSTDSLVQQWTNAMEALLSGGVQRKPKIPKGTRDYLPEQMMIRQQAFDIIRRVFAAHGAVEIDTPVFELKETLTGKYGEDSKLIYDLADQGGELLALRYDLTVPFARFLALNNVGHIKRYHIGKVYRRDQPALKRGRYREFYQCDFDIAGSFGRMVPDSECLCVVCDILDALPIGDFAIKVNHRCLLDAILDLCGVPAEKFRTICSAVDKLDKEPWEEVKREIVEDKGLQDTVADKIGEFVLNKGQPFELYKELMEAKRFGDHKGAAQAMEDLRILFEYLEAFDKLKFISFDLSLARGLDYYTGVIYEAVCISGNSQVGSIGGGGRYDNLVSMFQGAGKQTPCVGVSVGIERVFTLMEARLREEKGGSIKQPNVSVLIASAGGGGMMKEKMKIARMLWDANISAEFNQQEKSKLAKEITDALDREIPYMVVIGESELADNKCQVKDLKAETAELVAIPDLVTALRNKGVIPVGCEFAAGLLKQDLSV